jgi:hypothetical protein
VLSGLFADIGKDTAVYIQHVAVDGIRGMGSEEDGRTSELLWVEPTAGRCLGTDKAVEWMTAAVWLTLTERGGLWGSDVTRTDTVTLDVILTRKKTGDGSE